MPSTDDMSIRPARAEDEPAIDAVMARNVRDALAGLLGADYVPARAERTARMLSWTGPLGAPQPRHAMLVAERAGRILGFAAVGPARDAETGDETTGELRTVMVDDAARGSGAGFALVSAGEAAMRASGLSVAALWVLPENARAVRFYERCGWSADGTERTTDVAGRMLRSVRYSKRLGPYQSGLEMRRRV